MVHERSSPQSRHRAVRRTRTATARERIRSRRGTKPVSLAGSLRRWSATPVEVARAVRGGSAPIRRALTRRALTMAVVVSVAVVGARQIDAANRSERAWGDLVEVIVLTRDVAAGELVEPSAFETRRWPRSLVPHGAVRRVPSDSRRVTTSIVEGEVMLQSRWRRSGGAWAASLNRGESAVQVPLPAPLDGLAPGDRVDVATTAVSLRTPAGSPGDAPGVDAFADEVPLHPEDYRSNGTDEGANLVITRDARVLAVGPSTATIAVSSVDGPATASAAMSGSIALIIKP